MRNVISIIAIIIVIAIVFTSCTSLEEQSGKAQIDPTTDKVKVADKTESKAKPKVEVTEEDVKRLKKIAEQAEKEAVRAKQAEKEAQIRFNEAEKDEKDKAEKAKPTLPLKEDGSDALKEAQGIAVEAFNVLQTAKETLTSAKNEAASVLKAATDARKAATDAGVEVAFEKYTLLIQVSKPKYKGKVKIVLGTRIVCEITIELVKGNPRDEGIEGLAERLDKNMKAWSIYINEDGICTWIPRPIIEAFVINGPGMLWAFSESGEDIFHAYYKKDKD